MKKYIVVLLAACVLNIGLFVLMQSMVVQKRIRLADVADFDLASFIRIPETQAPPPSNREIPDKPAPAQKTQTKSVLNNTAQDMDFSVPTSFEFGFGSGLDAPKIYLDENLTAIMRAPVMYPSRALMQGVEGHVDILYTVNEQGLVQDPIVIASEPEGYFEKAAIRAINKWKYKPVVRDGQPVQIKAKVRLIFRMENS